MNIHRKDPCPHTETLAELVRDGVYAVCLFIVDAHRDVGPLDFGRLRVGMYVFVEAEGVLYMADISCFVRPK